MARDHIRIGCGAGFADDRIPPGVEIVERGELDYLAMECLAERTIARETLDRAKDPNKGYTPVLLERMEAIMPPALQRGVRIVTNMGAANPMGAARAVRKHAVDWGCPDYTCAVVTGDEVTEVMRAHPELPLMEDGAPLESLLPRMASANAYLGADVVARGFATGADVVITGRVADPALFLAPMLHAFGWSYDDYPKLANGTLAGHLMECSGQLTGGCFADPGKKEVEDLAGLGYPLADVWPDGRVEVSKTPGSGGRLDVATCTEQLLLRDARSHRLHNARLRVGYIRRHVRASLRRTASPCMAHAASHAPPPTRSWSAISMATWEAARWASPASMRSRAPGLGIEVVQERLRRRGLTYEEMRVDLIGMNSLHANDADACPEPYEVRLRIAARTPDRKAAEAVGAEVRSLHMQGPSGAGGGVNFGARQILAVKSVLIPREWVKPEIVMEHAA